MIREPTLAMEAGKPILRSGDIEPGIAVLIVQGRLHRE